MLKNHLTRHSAVDLLGQNYNQNIVMMSSRSAFIYLLSSIFSLSEVNEDEKKDKGQFANLSNEATQSKTCLLHPTLLQGRT